MHEAGFGIDVELRPVLRIGQAGHAAHDSDRAVGAHVAVDAGLGTQRRVARFTHNDDTLAVGIVDIGVAGSRPFDRNTGHVAEPGETVELGVVAVLRPHRHGIERQAENVDGGDGAEQRIGVGHRVRNGAHTAIEITALPYHGIGIAFRPDVGRLIQPLQGSEQIAAVGLRSRDRHQIDHLRLFR